MPAAGEKNCHFEIVKTGFTRGIARRRRKKWALLGCRRRKNRIPARRTMISIAEIILEWILNQMHLSVQLKKAALVFDLEQTRVLS